MIDVILSVAYLVVLWGGAVLIAWAVRRLVWDVNARDLSPEAEDELRRLIGREERRVSRDERVRQAVEQGRVP